MTKSLMLQGTGSDVGKSLLVAGLCRAAANRGVNVTCFKPQNMSNNAAVTPDGGEIGRAQALQAMACRRPASVHMNPVLLKPHSDVGAQIVVHGTVWGRADAADYQARKPELMGAVLDSFARLKAEADLIIVEGAGSAAETNLRTGDIANMGFATAANVPVVLVGDIDRGGVIANLVGTHAVLDAADQALVKGFIINRFRGDQRLFDDGLVDIERRTGWHGFGVVPWLKAAAHLPAEDAVVLDRPSVSAGALKVAVPMLSRIANFDDLDPLKAEPDVSVSFVPPGQPVPGDADVVVLPGTKATIADLGFLRAQGWDIDIAAHVRRGGAVLGLCGGYQMLGRMVADPDGIEGTERRAPGLGLLDIDTIITSEKTTVLVDAIDEKTGAQMTAYEIHAGQTTGPDTTRPMLMLGGAPQGAVSADGRIMGCYLHGLFTGDAYRRGFIERLGGQASALSYESQVDQALDDIAAALEAALDVDGLLGLAKS